MADFKKPMPANVDAERLVIGSILLDDSLYTSTARVLAPEDFFLEKHRRIFARMADLYDRGEHIDRVALAEELMRKDQLESIDGFSYLASLDEGLPRIPNIDGYVRIIKDKSISRSIIHICAEIKRRCLDYQESAEEICAAAEEMLLQVQHGRIFGDATSTAIHNQALQ